MIEYIVDIILAAIFLAITIKYYTRGFAKTIMSTIAFFLSLVLSGTLAGRITDWIFSNTSLFAGTAKSVAHMLVIVLSFAILSAVLNRLVSLINRIFKVPVLKQANKLLGALLGALCGLMVVFVICVALKVSADVVYNSKFISAVDHSVIMGWMDALV